MEFVGRVGNTSNPGMTRVLYFIGGVSVGLLGVGVWASKLLRRTF